MNYRLFLLLLFCLLPAQLSAQSNNYSLKGIITNSSGDPIVGATITIRKDSTEQILVGAVSDKDGGYTLSLHTSGTYLTEVRCVGYKTLQRQIAIAESNTMQNFILEENMQELSEVVIVAKYTKLKSNGNIQVQFKGNPIAKGKSSIEALRFIQGIEVVGENLLINGKEHTQIYLNGQQITLRQLNAIPTSMIEAIEVVPNPGAKFGSNARGGVLQVQLRKKEGLIGSVSLPTQFDRFGFVDVLPYVSMQYQKGDFTLFNTLYGGAGRYTTINRRYDKFDGVQQERITTINGRKKEYAIMDNFSMQYKATPRQTIGVFGGISYNVPHSYTNNTIRTGSEQVLEQGDQSKDFGLNGGVSYNGRFDIAEGSNASATLSYSHGQSNQEHWYTLGMDNRETGERQTGFLLFNPKASIQFLGGHTISSGLLFDYALDHNYREGISNGILAEVIKRKYSLTGYDFAPYIEYSKMFGKKFYIQAGLSYQQTVLHYHDLLDGLKNYKVTNRGLYPNIMLQYMIDQSRGAGIGLAYRHTFSLPNYGYYSPIATYQTKQLYSIGNPTLRKETFDEGELNYYINRDWTINYRLRYGRDIIQIMTHQDTSRPNLYYTRPENVGNRWSNYLSISFNKRIFSFWSTNSSIYFRHNTEQMPGMAVKSLSMGGTTVHQFLIFKHVGLTLSFSGETPRKKLGYSLGARYALDAGCYTSFLQDKLQLSLTLNNIVHGKDALILHYSNAELVRYNLSPRTRLKFTLTYSFSSGDQIKRSRGEKAQRIDFQAPVL